MSHRFPLGSRLRTSLLLCLIASGYVLAQGVKTPVPAVSASTAANQVRLLATPEVAQMRLEVFAITGERLYDSDFKPGNLFDWDLQEGQGQRLLDGAYRCLLTVKDLAGHESRRQGLLLVQAGELAWQTPEQAKDTLRAADQSGADGVEFFSVVSNDGNKAATALAHDGSQGRLMTGTGALSFRAGDFFAGKDQEQMRLTADGKLGLGVSDPQAKLDVGGLIRTSEGIVFPDGSIQTTAYVASGHNLSERVGMQREVQGRKLEQRIEDGSRAAPTGPRAVFATAGRLTKYADAVGNLADSGVLETAAGGGLVQTFGNTAATGGAFNHVVEIVAASGKTPLTLVGGAGAMEFWKDSTPTAAVAFGVAKPAVPAVATDDMVFSAYAQGSGWFERMRLTNAGKLGLGTINPQARLQVIDDIRSSALRQELTAYTPNVIEGFVGFDGSFVGGNRVMAGVVGATIGGGGYNGTLLYPSGGSTVGDNANRVTDWFGTIGGGLGNIAGNNSGTLDDALYATVGGGYNNTASGSSAFVGGGIFNTASGDRAFVGGGSDNTASGAFSVVPGGRDARATHYGELAFASGYFSSPGDAQASVYTLRRTTGNFTPTELFLDGDSAFEHITIAADRAFSFDILVVAKTANGQTAGYQLRGVIKNVGGTTSLVGAVTKNVLGEDDSSWDVTARADNPASALVVEATGAAFTTIRWVATVRIVKVQF